MHHRLCMQRKPKYCSGPMSLGVCASITSQAWCRNACSKSAGYTGLGMSSRDDTVWVLQLSDHILSSYDRAIGEFASNAFQRYALGSRIMMST